MQFEREILSMKFLTEEMWPLLERHYKEVSAFQDIPLKPDFEKYILMEKAGTLRVFTCRDNSQTADDEPGHLIGYAVYFVHPNIHYSTSLQAVQDVLYMERSKRGMGAGKDFIDWCDQVLRRENVQVVYHHVKCKIDFGPLLESLGYKQVEKIYARRLDG